MCGRFVLDIDGNFYPRFKIKQAVSDIMPKFNIAPSNEVPVIVNEKGENTLRIMKWGFIPFWAKDKSIGKKIINARSETIATKPSFKKAFRSQRCLVPSTGFYEWKSEAGKKVPHYIHLKTGKYFAMAGIFDRWKNDEAEILNTFTIITTPPNKIVKKFHHRMPAILKKDTEQVWLEKTDISLLLNLLKPFEGNLEEYTVTQKLNNPKIDRPDLLTPIQKKLI